MPEQRKILRPKVPGSLVRDPDTKVPLAEEGESKTVDPTTENGRFWLRRLELGDAVEVRSPAAEQAAHKPRPLAKE